MCRNRYPQRLSRIFLREVAEEMIADICSRAVPFDQLPSKVRVTHYWDGALHLREMAAEGKEARIPLYLLELEDAARRLASVGSGPDALRDSMGSVRQTQANPGPEEIGDLSKAVSHRRASTDTCSRDERSPKTRSRSSLDSFMEIRNECAHTGSAKNIPTTSDVRGYCELLADLGTGIVAVFQNVLAAPPYAVPAPAPARRRAPPPQP